MSLLIPLVCAIAAVAGSERVEPAWPPDPQWLLKQETAFVSPDGRRLAYVVRSGRDNERVGVVIDGRMRLPAAEYHPPVFADDGRFALLAYADNTWILAADDRRILLTQRHVVGPPRVGPQARRVLIPTREQLRFRVLDNQTPHPAFDQIDLDRAAFSADGQHAAYPARIGRYWHIVADGVAGPGWFTLDGPIHLAPDGSRRVYLARSAQGWCVVDQDQPGPAFPRITQLTLSADGRHTACWAMGLDGAWTLLLDGRAQPITRSRQCGAVVMSRDHDSVVVSAAFQDGGWVVRRNDETIAREPAIDPDSLAVSDDGSAVAFAAARDEGWFVRHQDQTLGPFEQVYPATFTFDPAGRRLAFVARVAGAAVVMLDSRAHDGGEAAGGLAFSPDGRALAWLRQEGQAGFRLCVSGVRTTHRFHDLPPGARPVWIGPGRVQLIGWAADPPRLLRHVVEMDGPAAPLADAR